MKVKKYLKQQAEQDRQEILSSDNGAFLRALEQEYTEQNKATRERKRSPRLKVWLSASISAVAAAAVITTCIVVYYPTGVNRVEYLDTNIVYVSANLDEFNNDVKEVEIQIDTTKYNYNILRAYDRVSGDTLYYSSTILSIDATVEIRFISVCNPNYIYKNFKLTDATDQANLGNYNVLYKSWKYVDPDFRSNILEANAEIHKGKEYFYITQYKEIIGAEDGSFLEVLQSILK